MTICLPFFPHFHVLLCFVGVFFPFLFLSAVSLKMGKLRYRNKDYPSLGKQRFLLGGQGSGGGISPSLASRVDVLALKLTLGRRKTAVISVCSVPKRAE